MSPADFELHGPTVGTRIRTLRLERGLTLAELARMSDCSRNALHRLEQGDVEVPRFSTITRLARALEIPVRSLVDADEPEAQADSRESVPEPSDSAREQSTRSAWDEAEQFDRSTNNVVDEVYAQHPELFVGWTNENWQELYSVFGTGGALNYDGVIRMADRMNRRGETVRQLEVVLETHLAEVAERLVAALYQSITVRRDAGPGTSEWSPHGAGSDRIRPTAPPPRRRDPDRGQDRFRA